MKNTLQSPNQLFDFLASTLPVQNDSTQHSCSASQPKFADPSKFIVDVRDGLRKAPMSVRLTPYILSAIDWGQPFEDPLRRQFIPLGSTTKEDHPELRLDSLHEADDSPVRGLVHRYPDKALFLGGYLEYL